MLQMDDIRAKTDDFADAVENERRRQHVKWGVQRHDHAVWMTVLTEEVGEAAAALLAMRADAVMDGNASDMARADLRAEIVQVAAVCAAWVEHLDEEAAP